MADSYDVTTNVRRKVRTRDAAGGWQPGADGQFATAPVPALQGLPARLHFYGSASQFRDEVSQARAPVQPQGAGTQTRERRFLKYLTVQDIHTNDIVDAFSVETGALVGTFNVLFVRQYRYSFQVDVEAVK